MCVDLRNKKTGRSLLLGVSEKKTLYIANETVVC